MKTSMNPQVLQFFQYYFVTLVACLGLAIFLFTFKVVSRRTLRYFLFTLIAIVLLVAFEVIQQNVMLYKDLIVWRKISAAFCYICRAGIVFFIVQVPTRRWQLKYRIINSIPFIVYSILTLISIPTGIVFSFNNNNEFIRGPLGYLPFIINSIYIFELLAYSIVKFRKKERSESLMISYIVIFCIVSVILETFNNLYGLIPGVSIALLILYYTGFVVNSYARDQLTDAYLRNKFFADRKRFKKAVTLISIDINGLKATNDTKGHKEGDLLLENFAHAAFDCLANNGRIYRIGGDEFIIIHKSTDNKIIDEYIQNVMKKCEQHNVSFSYGYALCKSSKDFESAMSEADKKMYVEKAEWHIRH